MSRILVWIIVLLVGLLLFKAASTYGGAMDENTMMRTFYYGAWAILAAGGVFAAQRDWGTAIRNLGLWTLIILALVAGYLYRNDAQDFASRMSAGLIPARAATITDENGFNSVVLYKAENGHYQADVVIDGTTVSMMVDTGATAIALTYEDAERIGLSPATLSFDQTVMTANGPARTASVSLPRVSIGGIERTNLRAGIAERGKLDQSLLGMNFLETLSAFSFVGDELKLRD